MTTSNDPSGANDGAGGAGDNQDDKQKKDTVSYDTHRKLLDEKKKVASERDALQAKLKEIEDKRTADEAKALEEQGNFKKLHEQEKTRAEKAEKERDAILENIREAQKRQAILRHVSGTVPENVREKLIDVSEVALNEDGSVNEDSAKLAAQEFEKAYPYLVDKGKGGDLPNEAAKGGAKTKLSYAEWQALPTAAEMKKRWKDVDLSTTKKKE